jgi:hypothetical protein
MLITFQYIEVSISYLWAADHSGYFVTCQTRLHRYKGFLFPIIATTLVADINSKFTVSRALRMGITKDRASSVFLVFKAAPVFHWQEAQSRIKKSSTNWMWFGKLLDGYLVCIKQRVKIRKDVKYVRITLSFILHSSICICHCLSLILQGEFAYCYFSISLLVSLFSHQDGETKQRKFISIYIVLQNMCLYYSSER